MSLSDSGSDPPHILVVDDHVGVVRALQLVLERRGFRVSTAADGLEGLTKAVEEHPDLIILDIDMPIFDGYEVTRRLRRHSETAHIPIIILSVKGQIDGVDPENKRELDRRVRQRIQAFEAGAVEFLSKPITAGELIKTINIVWHRLGMG